MKQKASFRRKRSSAKSVLRLPDLEHAKAAVLNSLNSADAKRGYRHAIDEFVDWYCSEPRLAFNRIVVLRYRSHRIKQHRQIFWHVFRMPVESHWDNVWAPRLAGFPVNIVYAARIEGVGLAQATYVFDPGTFIEGEQTRQMRYRPTIESDFSVLGCLQRSCRPVGQIGPSAPAPGQTDPKPGGRRRLRKGR
jgi:hypothetical protein